MVDAIPAGSRLLAEDLSPWSTAINAALEGTIKHKAADTSRASTTTFADDPHLTTTVVANGIYSVELLTIYQAGATGQFKHQLTFPSGTMEAPSYAYDPGTADMQAVAASSSPGGLTGGFTGTAGNVPIWFRATLYVGVTGGTLAYQWAQTVSNATATIVRKGSRLEVIRIA